MKQRDRHTLQPLSSPVPCVCVCVCVWVCGWVRERDRARETYRIVILQIVELCRCGSVYHWLQDIVGDATHVVNG